MTMAHSFVGKGIEFWSGRNTRTKFDLIEISGFPAGSCIVKATNNVSLPIWSKFFKRIYFHVHICRASKIHPSPPQIRGDLRKQFAFLCPRKQHLGTSLLVDCISTSAANRVKTRVIKIHKALPEIQVNDVVTGAVRMNYDPRKRFRISVF